MRVGLVNLGSYPALVDTGANEMIGGEEVQHAILARMLAAAGIDSCLLSSDFGQEDGSLHAGVRVFRAYRPHEGIPGVRFLWPRWHKLNAAMRRSGADLFYVSCAGALVGQVVAFARAHGAKVVFRVASDSDCVPDRLLVGNVRDRWLYEYGLRRADAIAAQSETQRASLQKNYRLASEVVPLVLDVDDERPSAVRDIDVLWVANLRALKRPEIFVRLAKSLPAYSFHLVGGEFPAEPQVSAGVLRAAAAVPNITLHGRLGYLKTLELFRRARLFVNTSELEGFPNTFLQAWARGVPTVSFFDPDQSIARNGLGSAVVDESQLASAVTSWLQQGYAWAAASERCVRFIEQRYPKGKMLAPYLQMFDRVMTTTALAARVA